ncbi:oxygenase, catalysing oxidative methylation of damaged DNA family protein [Burkholderia pseudomallei TSV 25]|uniref:2OG-Fe(II) oxygenase n=1 Tax=Burkholderia pseudomallei TaxID=28450 RepID=UPI00050DB689|nr:2OG-Fe(II) oxygenase [Burkholderia pseudomallei]AIV48086.1 oxygenase, catalysing oxidative methylation of damaged DNA family protein [Burkholderia pseudomallei TSV 48]KGC35541.1 oxygenase, catalysing oxidative methylation of damaged DNA family protein [Burkholderia pseudomallei]KGW09939.1 oxygenase, catalysing oxidative methylation of damaged DNA family protein [Burkholderia pseudomallei TSV 25]KIX58642.1 prolyl 4-hydroxylase [Burkholderia pseudomallei]
MIYLTANIDRLNWLSIAKQLDTEGYAVLPDFLSEGAARDLVRRSNALSAARSVSLASIDLGRGELIYLGMDLSMPVELWRTAFYPHLAKIANRWNETLGVSDRYPPILIDFFRSNQKTGQVKAQTYLSRLRTEDHIALHQRSESVQVFPLQVVVLLSEPGVDFLGGEFVMTEQRPRMQSRPMVLPLKLGDAAIIATAERPFRGTKGYYRVNLKHAISRVRKGERVGLELSFHSAP